MTRTPSSVRVSVVVEIQQQAGTDDGVDARRRDEQGQRGDSQQGCEEHGLLPIVVRR